MRTGQLAGGALAALAVLGGFAVVAERASAERPIRQSSVRMIETSAGLQGGPAPEAQLLDAWCEVGEIVLNGGHHTRIGATDEPAQADVFQVVSSRPVKRATADGDVQGWAVEFYLGDASARVVTMNVTATCATQAA